MSTEMCYSCTTSFSVFNKQLGCKNCGFGFCKKCLTKKTNVPKLNDVKAAVCNNCFDILTGKSQPVVLPPPDAYAKRVMAASQQNHQHMPKATAPDSKGLGKGLSREDAALAKRLENLKQDRRAAAAPVPSQAEIESRMSKLKEDRVASCPSDREIKERLAVVRGQDPKAAAQPAVLKPQSRKTQPEQVDDLLNEICDEVEIDSRATKTGRGVERNDLSREDLDRKAPPCTTYNISEGGEGASSEKSNLAEIDRLMRQTAVEMELDAKRAIEDLRKDKELRDRMERLKADRSASSAGGRDDKTETEEKDDTDEDEETAAQKVIQQLMEENRLDDEVAKSGCQTNIERSSKCKVDNQENRTDSDEDLDELPWCCICNRDAVLRCRGCDGDLYCQRCYREGHNRHDFEDHPTVPYKKK